MVMDGFKGLHGSDGGLKLVDDSLEPLSDQQFADRFNLVNIDQNHVNIPLLPPHPVNSNAAMYYSRTRQELASHEDCDFSDVVLKYISDMLMEEDMEEKACMFQESSVALQAAEKSLYELIGEKYPLSPSYSTVSHLHDNPAENQDLNHGSCASSTCSSSASNLANPGCYDLSEHGSLGYAPSNSHSSHSPGNSSGSVVDGFVDSLLSTGRISKVFSESESLIHYKKGFEEASKFIPDSKLFIHLEDKHLFCKGQKEEADLVAVKMNGKRESKFSLDGLSGKKNPHPEDLNLEEDRGAKQSVVYSEPTVTPADFDMVLLNCGQSESVLRVAWQNSKSKNMQSNGQTKGSNGGKSRGKKLGGKRNVVDLRTLLTLCAQAVAVDDRRTANDLLKQIRQNASPTGDGMQRLALDFADGLEARLAGSGTKIYKAFITRATSAADVLKAYHLFLAACPFRKLSNFFSNKTIMNVSEKAERLHIVDFGILYGFQWPCLIQRLSSRPSGPPKLRITGIDLPQPGFRPAERVEETGRRLKSYADTFKVPFEFNAIAQKWDTIQLEDLKIDRNEVLVVNCMYRLRNLLDETVMVESPRNAVLSLMRRMNPDVFIQGVVNGAYSAPFFLTRFREALFHYSTLFDMLESNVPREVPERMLIEREIFGREAMNVIACEGAERIERPETYKQWHARNLRAGFRQLSLNQEIFETAMQKVNEIYHKDFVIDEDNGWLLQGWKGRIVYALTSWKPNT